MGTLDDPTQYGRSFADVYDEWYALPTHTDDVVTAIVKLLPPPARVLELGVGTGRLAIPLAAAGYDVVGIDSSPEMLDRIPPERTWQSAGRLKVHVDDATRLDGCDDESADVIVAALNLVMNLVEPDGLSRCLAACARVAAANARLVVECDVLLDLVPGDESSTVVDHDGVSVAITTSVRPDGRVIDGRHQQLDAHGRPSGRPRPWSVRAVDIEELDALARQHGWRLERRSAAWASAAPTDGGPVVSWFRRESRDAACG